MIVSSALLFLLSLLDTVVSINQATLITVSSALYLLSLLETVFSINLATLITVSSTLLYLLSLTDTVVSINQATLITVSSALLNVVYILRHDGFEASGCSVLIESVILWSLLPFSGIFEDLFPSLTVIRKEESCMYCTNWLHTQIDRIIVYRFERWRQKRPKHTDLVTISFRKQCVLLWRTFLCIRSWLSVLQFRKCVRLISEFCSALLCSALLISCYKSVLVLTDLW